MTNKSPKDKSHATHLGISARLTAVALTKLGDVSTVAKTLVEVPNDVLQNLDATGSVDSSLVHAGGAQTLAKFFYDRNGHGRGEVLVTSWACHVFVVMSCVLERVVPIPKVLYVCRRATAVTSCLYLWVTGNRHVCGSCKLRGPKKKWLNICTTKYCSTYLAPLITKNLIWGWYQYCQIT